MCNNKMYNNTRTGTNTRAHIDGAKGLALVRPRSPSYSLDVAEVLGEAIRRADVAHAMMDQAMTGSLVCEAPLAVVHQPLRDRLEALAATFGHQVGRWPSRLKPCPRIPLQPIKDVAEDARRALGHVHQDALLEAPLVARPQ